MYYGNIIKLQGYKVYIILIISYLYKKNISYKKLQIGYICYKSAFLYKTYPFFNISPTLITLYWHLFSDINSFNMFF